MFIICGLGNPGERYINTRHNVGFDLIEKIIKKFDFELLKKDKKKEIYTGLIDKKKCLIIKPLTFMNLSGIPIKELLNFYKELEENDVDQRSIMEWLLTPFFL